ncbi:hypothetical protein XELAEV_18040237mg [Xenopus laevis]|uniref:Olfactory receptor n=1 Tax=Xenopus laevis TaxID=8355 RepID=A0A974H8P9_XENLA|nr:hypothetical protein XELAEV_18040237mg [Xenopus laevis]
MAFNQSVTEFIIIGLSSLGRFRHLFFSFLLTAFIFIITGNCLISLVIFKNRHLHTPMYFLISTLSSLELCCSIITVPGMLIIAWKGKTYISTTSCFLQMYLIHFFGITENYILSVMAYDRYLAICKPLQYHIIMTYKHCKILICSCYLLGFLSPLSLLLLLTIIPFCGSNIIYSLFCDASPVLDLACADVSVTHVLDTAVGLGTIIITSLYILFVYIKIMLTIVNMNESKERKKAFSNCIALFVVALIFYGSVTFMYIIMHGEYTTEYEEAVAINYFILTPLFNPIIYCLRNKEIKKSLIKILIPFKQIITNRA